MSWRLTSPKFLVGHWPLNNHSADVSGQGNDGVWTGEAYTDGPYGKSVGNFTGANYINLDAHVGDYSALTEGTISCYFKSDDPSILETFLALSDIADGSSEIAIGTNPLASAPNKIGIGIREDGAGFTTPGVKTIIADVGYHLAIVVSSSGTIIYIDAEYDTSSVSTLFFSSVSGLDSMKIGANEDSAGIQWLLHGNLKNLRIYNIPLTQDEVIALNRMDKRI